MESPLEKMSRQKNQMPEKKKFFGGNFQKKKGIWVNLNEGDNVIRLVGSFIKCQTRYPQWVAEKAAMEYKEGGSYIPKVLTDMNWDIKNEEFLETDLWCDPMEDLKEAADKASFKLRKKAKELDDEAEANALKDEANIYSRISYNASSKARFKWKVIFREDPYVIIEDEDGKKKKKPSFKILDLPEKAQEELIKLFKQKKELSDPENGNDIIITVEKKKAKNGKPKTEYSASFVFDDEMKVVPTPLSEEELEYEDIDISNFTPWYKSPRDLFRSLTAKNKDLILEVLGKTEEDYPEEHPVKREKKVSEDKEEDDDDEKDEKIEPPISSKSKKVDVSDAFDDISSDDEDKTDDNEGDSTEDDNEESEDDEEDSNDGDDDMIPECFGNYDDEEDECNDCSCAKSCKKETK